jgi:hypothetical protein
LSGTAGTAPMAETKLVSVWGGDPDLTVDSLVPTVFLRWWLGDVHVGTSDLEVAREVWARIKKQNDPAWTPELRRQTLAAALWLHHENRAEYAAVMSGRF